MKTTLIAALLAILSSAPATANSLVVSPRGGQNHWVLIPTSTPFQELASSAYLYYLPKEAAFRFQTAREKSVAHLYIPSLGQTYGTAPISDVQLPARTVVASSRALQEQAFLFATPEFLDWLREKKQSAAPITWSVTDFSVPGSWGNLIKLPIAELDIDALPAHLTEWFRAAAAKDKELVISLYQPEDNPLTTSDLTQIKTGFGLRLSGITIQGKSIALWLPLRDSLRGLKVPRNGFTSSEALAALERAWLPAAELEAKAKLPQVDRVSLHSDLLADALGAYFRADPPNDKKETCTDLRYRLKRQPEPSTIGRAYREFDVRDLIIPFVAAPEEAL
jgi:hypothetical protein